MLDFAVAIGRKNIFFGLIVIELAVAMAVVANASGAIAEKWSRLSIDTGLAEDELMIVQISPRSGQSQRFTVQEDLEFLRSQQYVRSVSKVNQIPFGFSSATATIRTSVTESDDAVVAATYEMSRGGLETLGLRLVDGRGFSRDEYQYTSVSQTGPRPIPNVAIITKALAERLFVDGSPIGEHFYSAGNGPITIIGVLDRLVAPYIDREGHAQYSVIFPLLDRRSVHRLYVLRAERDKSAEILKSISEYWRSTDSSRQLTIQAPLVELRRLFLAQDRYSVTILVVFAAALVVMAAIGIEEVTRWWVSVRSNDFAVMRAICATRGDIIRLCQFEIFGLSVIGIVVGTVIAVAANEATVRFLGAEKLSLFSLTSAGALILLVSQFAALPATLATIRIDPAQLLRVQ